MILSPFSGQFQGLLVIASSPIAMNQSIVAGVMPGSTDSVGFLYRPDRLGGSLGELGIRLLREHIRFTGFELVQKPVNRGRMDASPLDTT